MMLVPAGFAVIRQGKLAGYLPPETAVGATILLKSMHYTNVEVDDGAGGLVTLGVTRSDWELTPVFENGTLKELQIHVATDADLIQMDTALNVQETKVRRGLEQKLALYETEQITEAIRLSQEMGMDLFDFAQQIRMQEPKAFREIEAQWETLYPALPVTVSVGADLLRTYDIDKPIQETGES